VNPAFAGLVLDKVNWREPLADTVREHLPPDLARRFIELLRPAFNLDTHIDGPVVGQLGGLPMLPDDLHWPVWKISANKPMAPLPYRAGIDCGALPSNQLDIPLPAAGTLHFFADSDCFDDEEPGQHRGSRILYVPAGVDVRERQPPPYDPTWVDQVVSEPVELRARLIASAPWYYSPFMAAAFWQPGPDYDFGEGPDPNWMDTAASSMLETLPDGFGDALLDYSHRYVHLLGGYVPPVQRSPEYDMWPRSDYPFRDDNTQTGGPGQGQAGPGRQPGRLLFSMEDDIFRLDWVIRPDDLAALRFEAAFFRLQRGW
jgi:hypothetical protein